jgi:hypothetical protein
MNSFEILFKLARLSLRILPTMQLPYNMKKMNETFLFIYHKS